ncbi:MAG: hypothetical protein AAFO07_11895 [Bacteroidota bacterium]
MERNSLDDQLKKSLGAYEGNVDLEALWSSIEPELPPEKDRKRIFLWWLMSGLVFFLLFGTTSDVPVTSKEVVEEIIALESTSKEVQPALTIKPNTLSISTIEKGKKEEGISMSQLNLNNTINPITINQGSKSVSNSTPSKIKSSATDLVASKQTETPEDFTSSYLKEIHLLKRQIPRVQYAQQLTAYGLSTIQSEVLPQTLSLLPTIEIHPLITASNPIPTIKPQKITPKSKWEIDLDLMFGLPGINYRINQKELADNILAKEQSEDPWWTISNSLLVGYKINSKVRLKTGVSLMWMYERFKHSSITDTVILQDYSKYFYVQGPQDTAFFNEPVELSRSVHQDITHFNQYRMLQIPIGVSYQFNGLGQRWEIEGGALLNLNIRRQGKALDLDKNVTELAILNPNTGISLGYYANMGLVLRPNERLNYLIKAQASYFPTGLTQTNPAFDQSFYDFGLKVGLRYRF